MADKQVRFGEWVSAAFDLYKQNFGILVLASLVALLLSAVSFGILAGPMMAGLALITLGIVDKKEQKRVGELFDGFNYFLQSFLFVLVWGAIMLVAGLVLNMIAGIASLVLGTFLMFAIYLIVDRGLPFWPASVESMKTVKADFWPLLGYYVVATILGSVGSVVCGIGVFLTFPIGCLMYTIAYREYFPAGTAEVPPAVAPPAPENPDAPAAG